MHRQKRLTGRCTGGRLRGPGELGTLDARIGIEMGIGSRHFIMVGNDVAKISQRVRCEFYFKGKAVLKEYAGQIIDIADVYVKIENRQPQEIIRIDCVRHKVTGKGALDDQYEEESSKLILHKLDEPKITSIGSVVNASEKFDEKRLKHKYEWELSPQLLSKIIVKIFK